MSDMSRRRLLGAAGLAGAGLVAQAASAQTMAPVAASAPVAPIGNATAVTVGSKISLPPLHADSEINGPLANPDALAQRIGVAVVGLGHLALEQILPAFGTAKSVKLMALVSGHREKAKTVAAQYGVSEQRLYSYETFDRIIHDPTIGIVYIALPNNMHAEFTIRAAKAGKHVLCEKPMATSAEDARKMVAACHAAKVRLMIAYRCQYEKHHRAATEIVRSQIYGKLRFIEATNCQNDLPGAWRFDKKMAGGGSLPDVGLYCSNAFRYLTGEEPIEITARTTQPANDPRFKEVEDIVQFSMVFPSGVIATGLSSYSAHETRVLRAVAESGSVTIDNAFAYQNLSMIVDHKNTEGSQIADVQSRFQLAQPNQFATEMDHFADCIRHNRVPRTPGEEGLQDMMILEAIYRAAETGNRVTLPAASKPDETRGPAL